MPSRTLPGLGLAGFWLLGEDGWNTENDQNLLMLSALVQLSVISRVTALPGSPTNGDIYIVPDGSGANEKKIAVRDDGAWAHMVPLEGWRAWVKDTDELVIFDGTSWAAFESGGGGLADAPSDGKTYGRKDAAWVEILQSYDLRFGFTSSPASSAVIDTIMIARDVDLPANMSGSLGRVGVNPTATFDMLLKDDGTTIGTISVSTSGVFTFTTSGGTAKSIVSGSVLTLEAPASVDATVANMTMTIVGTIG